MFKIIFIFAVIHFLTVLFFGMMDFGTTMKLLDQPNVELNQYETVIRTITDILIQPLKGFMDYLESVVKVPNYIWTISFIMNSFLWGSILALIFKFFYPFRKKSKSL